LRHFAGAVRVARKIGPLITRSKFRSIAKAELQAVKEEKKSESTVDSEYNGGLEATA
jgi:hypothetical protein